MLKLTKKITSSLPILFLLFGFAWHAQAYADPEVLVKDTTDKMLSALKAEKAAIDKDPKIIYGLVKEIAVPHFDFIGMSKWVLGKYWRRASKEQKLRFIRAFRSMMVRTYAVALLDYTDQKINFLPLRDDVTKGDVTVKTEVVQAGKPAVAVNYSLHLKKSAWKVYNISVDGISLIANYRTSFATEIKQQGLDSLIERLEKHNEKAK